MPLTMDTRMITHNGKALGPRGAAALEGWSEWVEDDQLPFLLPVPNSAREEWWRRLNRFGLDAGHLYSTVEEDAAQLAHGRARRHSV